MVAKLENMTVQRRSRSQGKFMFLSILKTLFRQINKQNKNGVCRVLQKLDKRQYLLWTDWIVNDCLLMSGSPSKLFFFIFSDFWRERESF